jgi:uncharacterized protein YoxC
MEIIAIAVVVSAISFIVLVAFLILALIEIRKTAISVRIYVNDLESQTQLILKELHIVTINLRVFSDVVVSRSDELESFMVSLGETGRNLSKFNVVIGEVAGFLCRPLLWFTGLKAAGQYTLGRILQQQKGVIDYGKRR